jgi:hypothetical protein
MRDDNTATVGCGVIISIALVATGLGWWLGGPGLILAGVLIFVAALVIHASTPKS